MRFAEDGFELGMVNFDPPGREPEPVFVFCFEVDPPVPRWVATLFFISRLRKKARRVRA